MPEETSPAASDDDHDNIVDEVAQASKHRSSPKIVGPSSVRVSDNKVFPAMERVRSAVDDLRLAATPTRPDIADDWIDVPVDVQSGGQSGLSGGGFSEISQARGDWNNAGGSLVLSVGDERGARDRKSVV